MIDSYFLCPLCGNRLAETSDPKCDGFVCKKCGFSNEYEKEVPILVPCIYYIDEKQGNKQCGPVSPLDVVITPDTYVWMEKMKDWTQARNVRELYTFFECPKKKVTYLTETASSPEMAMFNIERQSKDEQLLYRAVANPAKHRNIVYGCILFIVAFALILSLLISPDILTGLLIGVLISSLVAPLTFFVFGNDLNERNDHRLDSVIVTNECVWVIYENMWHCLALDYIDKCEIDYYNIKGKGKVVFFRINTRGGEKLSIDLSYAEIKLKKFVEALNGAAKREIIDPNTSWKALLKLFLPLLFVIIYFVIVEFIS